MEKNSQGRIRTIRDLDIAGKTVFLRVDFNVPLNQFGADGVPEVKDDSRIRESLPTIEYAREQGAKLVLASHLGRPHGQLIPKLSLKPIADHLASLLDCDVLPPYNCTGCAVEQKVRAMKPGEAILLENLRFHEGEESENPDDNRKFSEQLRRLCDVYVTDAFGTAHREHASTYGLPALMASQNKGIGLLVEKELKFLGQLLGQSSKPFYLVLGGSKVTDKIKTIKALLERVDGFVVGGAMAFAFWAIKGIPIPKQAIQPKPKDISAAEEILKEAEAKQMPFRLPTDTNQEFDIGPNTIAEFIRFLADAKTVFWSGPLGKFEEPAYARGTFEIARAVAELSALKMAGGGETVSAIKQSGTAEKWDHLSTGGSATLEYLEKGHLPGIDIIK